MDAHAHEKWDVVKELPLLTNQGQNRKQGDPTLTEELCKKYGVDKIQGDNSDKALKGAMVHRSGRMKRGPKREEVVVPVFATLLVKKVVEDPDGGLSLIGTFIQRPLLYDLQSFDRESGNQPQPYFDMRVNDGVSNDCFELKKVARDLSAGPKMDRDRNGKDEAGYFATAASTFVATMPLKLDSVYSEPPFNIMSATVMVELTSFIGTNALNEKFELRPSFVSHASDLRNLCCVRDWKDDFKIDEMKLWEFVTPQPTLEFEYDGCFGKRPLYVPRLRVTFFLYEDFTRAFTEKILPVTLAYVASTWNLLHVGQKQDADYADYLANSAAISLTVVFIIGSMMDSESCSRGFQAMTLFAYWTFLSMILMVPAFYFSRSWQKIAIAVMWTSMLIPLRNTIIYNLVLGKIRSNWIHKRDLSMTFLGRPGSKSDWQRKHEGLSATAGKSANKKGSMGALDADLRTFVVKTPGNERRPKIMLNPDVLSHAAQVATYYQAGTAKRGRFEPW